MRGKSVKLHKLHVCFYMAVGAKLFWWITATFWNRGRFTSIEGHDEIINGCSRRTVWFIKDILKSDWQQLKQKWLQEYIINPSIKYIKSGWGDFKVQWQMSLKFKGAKRVHTLWRNCQKSGSQPASCWLLFTVTSFIKAFFVRCINNMTCRLQQLD